MKIIINLVTIVSAVLVLSSCDKQESDPLMDQRPDVPVTFTNAADYRPDPTVTCSLKDSMIQIALSIPAQSGITISEITKIAASTSYSKIQAGGASGFYVATPIPVNGTSFTYKTTLKEYFTLFPVSSSNPAATINTELGLRFYFLIKLSDGTPLVTLPVRVLVLQ